MLAFAASTVIAAVLLLAYLATGPLGDAWHPVVTVNGVTINRGELRARILIDGVLAVSRRTVLRSALSAGRLGSDDFERIAAMLEVNAGDPLRSAIDGLVRDQLLRTAARDEGISPAVDVDAELRAAAAQDLGLHLRAVTIALPQVDAPTGPSPWPAPPPASADRTTMLAARQAALARAAEEQAAGATPEETATALAAAGWRATAVDRWIPMDGPVDGLPDALVAEARGAAQRRGPAVLDPVLDTVSATDAIGEVIEVGDAPPVDPNTDGLDRGALERWAQARADERALRDRLANSWRTEPQPMVRVRELVIGSAGLDGVDGEYRSFAHLVVGQLPASIKAGDADGVVADRLASDLRSLAADARLARFAELVDAANLEPAVDPLARSGELGFYTRDQLLPDIAGPAFAPGSSNGDLIGPVVTTAGPELFLVRGRFSGILDERSSAVLIEARTNPDLPALARRVAPVGEWLRADGSLWRALAETAATGPLRSAYGDTPVDGLSDPIVLGDQLITVRVEERSTALVPPDVLDRLLVRGADAWIASLHEAARIERDPEPLPGVLVESPTPTAMPPGGSNPIPTPNLPSLPVAQ
jgi:hypothetical protein